MACYLGEYKGAAMFRPSKLRRAIKSVINQTHTDWELIVVADGCEQCKAITLEYDDSRIRGFIIPKQKIWSGVVRNVGIERAAGDYILYLDSDDNYAPTYLAELNKAILAFPDYDWYYVNDITFYDRRQIRRCNIDILGKCGTSNVIHKASLDVWWDVKDNYAHDYKFIKNLKKASPQYKYLDIAGYEVNHIPGRYDM